MSPKEILHRADDSRRGLTWSELAQRVRAVAAGLIALGVQHGDRVAVMAPTSLEWTLADLAILSVGAATVPIDEGSTLERCAWILSDAAAGIAVAGTADQAKALESARPLREVVVLADAGLDALAEGGSSADFEQVVVRTGALSGSDLATVLYPPDPGARPEGRSLTHDDLLFTIRQCQQAFRSMLAADASTLLALPLADPAARIMQLLCLEADVTLGYPRSADRVAEGLRALRPTILVAGPPVLDAAFAAALRKPDGTPVRFFDLALSAAAAWSGEVGDGWRPGLPAALRRRVADALVYRRVREDLGGRLRWCVPGGDRVALPVVRFMHAAGICVLEGYGPPETSGLATSNTPEHLRIGTRGQPLPGVEVRIAGDGEVLVRRADGRPVDPAAAAIDDGGWLRSGDLGAIDSEGYVRITGRVQDTFVTAGGTLVVPEALEERLRATRLISWALVVGEGRPFVGALISLDAREMAAFAEEHGLDTAATRLSRTPEVQEEIARAVELASAEAGAAESIRKVVVLDVDVGRDSPEPGRGARRRAVNERFARQIDRLYAT